MTLLPVPIKLQNLTQCEEMLIARACPVMYVYTKPRGGQKIRKGHVITLPQNVQQLVDVLPRCPKGLPIIVFRIDGKSNESPDFIVCRQKVYEVLELLIIARNSPSKNSPIASKWHSF